MQKNFQSLLSFPLKHKFLTGVAVLVVAGGGYWAYAKFTSTADQTRYVTASVARGTIITSVSGSGQVSVSNQIDLKPKVSGDLVYIGVTEGQQVETGKVIAQLDSRDAQKSIRDAEASLQTAQLALEKLQQPTDKLSLTQAQNAVASSQDAKQKAQGDLQKAYDDGFNDISDAFLDIPNIMSGLDAILNATSLNTYAQETNINYFQSSVQRYDVKVLQYHDDTRTSYENAKKQYDTVFTDYKTSSRASDTPTLERLIQETYDTTKIIADTLKNANTLIIFYRDKVTEHNITPPASVATYLTDLNTYTGEANSHLSALLSVKNTIKDSRDTITSSDRTIQEKNQSLEKLQSGTDPLDIQTQELTIKQRENALGDAKNTLSDYSVVAPFSGTIAKLNSKKGDPVTSATVIATLITNQKIAQITVNEVDAAKIKVGQKATLTFDAIQGLTITGGVAVIDTLGTVAQGVVSYTVKIGFDTQDDRVKPGMSVSAAIVTDVKPDVLMVPNSAIKTQNGVQHVDMFDQPLIGSGGNQGSLSAIPPRQQQVETGFANDTSTEITSGLKEGDQIVTRTVKPSTTTTTTQAPSLFPTGGGTRGFGGGGGGGGAGAGR